MSYQAIREKATGRLTEWCEMGADPEAGTAHVLWPTDPEKYERVIYEFDPQTKAEEYLGGGNPGAIHVDKSGNLAATAATQDPGPPQACDALGALKQALAAAGVNVIPPAVMDRAMKLLQDGGDG